MSRFTNLLDRGKPYLPQLLFFLLWAILIGLNSSKAILSVGWVSLTLLAFLHTYLYRSKVDLPSWKDSYWWPTWLLAGLWVLALINGWYTEDVHRWSRDLRTKVPFLLFPFALALLPAMSERLKRFLALSFLYAQAVWAVMTLVNFALDYEAQMQRVRENGNVDVPGSISHIYFGLLLAFAVLLGVYLWLHHRKNFAMPNRVMVIVATLICLLTLHVLNSRTAQLSFYAGFLAGLGVEVWRNKAYLVGAGMLVLLLALPMMAYFTLPSFRARVAVTVWDYQQYQLQFDVESLANNSFSTRLVGWRAAWEIFKENPWLGVGLEDLNSEMVMRYQAWGLSLPDPVPSQLKVPHNQYLKYMAGSGILGLAWLLGVLLLPLFNRQAPYLTLRIAFTAMMAVGLLAENFLEREIGVIFFCVAYILLQRPQKAEGVSPEKVRAKK